MGAVSGRSLLTKRLSDRVHMDGAPRQAPGSERALDDVLGALGHWVQVGTELAIAEANQTAASPRYSPAVTGPGLMGVAQPWGGSHAL